MTRLLSRLARLLPATLCAALLVGGLAAPDSAQAAPSSDRIAGADRYETSVAASMVAFPDASKVDTVYLAAGVNYPDALAAGPVAVLEGAALLLTHPDWIPAAIAAELRRLAPKRIVIVGATAAVSSQVERAAKGFAASVERVGGSDRYETARLLVQRAFGGIGAPHVWIATGNNYPDALSASPAAARTRSPVLLVHGGDATLDTPTRALLKALGTTSVSIAGSAVVVSSGIESELKKLVGMKSVARFGGTDRFATAALINAATLSAAPAGDAYVATGLNFPDALSVAVLAGLRGRPLYLSDTLCAPAVLAAALGTPKVTRIRLVGGPSVLRGYVSTLKPCLSADAVESPWLVVNKNRQLSPADYVPGDLVQVPVAHTWAPLMRAEASSAIVAMFQAAANEAGLSLASNSAYRSYATQQEIYAGDDNLTARPGYSEHQTGLTMDIGAASGRCSLSTCFADTVEGAWLAGNAWRFGFLLRYPADKTGITGYDFEPWHYRYIGTDLAANMRADGYRTLEEYFGLPAAPVYP